MDKILLIINRLIAMSKIINFAERKAKAPAPAPAPEQPKTRFLFTPQKNITTYELAMCIMHLFGKPISIADAQQKYMRHFTMETVEPKPEQEK